MLHRLLKGLTFANVCSFLALTIALGTGTAYAVDTVGSEDIIDNSIQSVDIKNGNVSTSDIANATITGADLHADSVTAASILDGTIANADLAPDAVNSANVVNESLTAADLASDSVGSSEIPNNAVGATEVASNSIDSGEVVDFGLTNEDVGVLFAQVNANGTVANSSGGVTSIRIAMGQYGVDFGRNISACAFTATQGESGAGGAPGAILGVTDRGGNVEAVFVTVRNTANAAVDRAFQLTVVC